MLKKSDSRFDFETITERMRAGARRRHTGDAAAPHSVSHAPQGTPVSGTEQSDARDLPLIVLQPPFRPQADDHYHVNDLLRYHDRAFVQNAYLAILKRGPDATGYGDFIEALRSGSLNKIDVLARLRYSREGRAKAVAIDGLIVPASIRLLYHVPLLGYLVNLAVGLARLPNALRHEQQFQAHVLAQQELIAEHTNELQRHFEGISREQQTVCNGLLMRLVEIGERFEKAMLAQQADALSRLSRLSEQFESALVSEQTARERSHNQLTSFVGDEQAAREEAFRTLSIRVGEESSRLREDTAMVERRLAALGDTRQTQANALAQELKTEMQKLFQKQQEVRAELVLQGARVTRLLDETAGRLAGLPQQPESGMIAEEAEHTLDAFYLSLEDQFRGSRAEIKQRLRVYLPPIQEAGIGRDEKPVLDVGCGRGEWLELLREEGLVASGVDSNRVLVQECRERNLEVVQGDLLSHLRSLPDASLGAITGFHVIEHLPFETLIKFLDETVRTVKPGGLVIFETPNPQNVLVGSCNFYFDPTHRNPLPSPITKFLLESRGFTRVQVLNLNPSDEAPVAGDSDLARRFNQYFYGPMDYAVVGRRP